MAREKDDWRLTGQEGYLLGAALTWKLYRARGDHDHCAFCWAKFMDPDVSETHRRDVDEHPDVLTEGYATTPEHDQGAEYHWVCRPCDDFVDRFEWRVIPAD